MKTHLYSDYRYARCSICKRNGYGMRSQYRHVCRDCELKAIGR